MLFNYKKAINYSGYRLKQSPLKKKYPTKAEILEDLKLLEGEFYYLRLFDCSPHAYRVLELIETHKLSFKVMLGLSLAAEENFKDHPYFYTFTERQLTAHRKFNGSRVQEIIDLGNRYENIVSSISIGNEVQSIWTNNLISEKRLIEIARTIQEGTNVPVTFCEEYQYWLQGLEKLAQQLDFISLHTYPAWRNIPIDEAVEEAVKNYTAVQQKYPDKPCIITETGWPTKSHGAKIHIEDANVHNQYRYINSILDWAEENQTLVYLFEAFDEPWKGQTDPDEPEKNWGLYDVKRQRKS